MLMNFLHTPAVLAEPLAQVVAAGEQRLTVDATILAKAMDMLGDFAINLTVAAIIFALTNLDPEHWKNRQNIDGNIQSDVRFTGFQSVLPNVPDIEAMTKNVREQCREKFLNGDE